MGQDEVEGCVRPLAIQTEGLTKRFARTVAVDRLSFEVPNGSLFGLLGPNGAGKTTTLSILCGFLRPDAGNFRILGEAPGVVPFGRISALPQDARFYTSRTVAESLRFLAELSGMDQSHAKSECDRLIEVVGLMEARNVRCRDLSHGMRKRFGIAQAFIGSPELVLLDEPTEGLDPRNAHQIRELIRSIAGKSTIVISSHNLAEVQEICDHAAIIAKGRLIEAGTIEELTRANERVTIELGQTNTQAIEAVRAMPAVVSVEVIEGKVLQLTLRCDGDVEATITAVLKVLVEHGATVGTITRGRPLIERYLEVT